MQRNERGGVFILLVTLLISVALLVSNDQVLAMRMNRHHHGMKINSSSDMMMRGLKSKANIQVGAAGLPGMTISIQQRSLNYMAQQFMPLIQQKLSSGFNIPDIHTEDHTPIGKVELSATNIQISGVSLATPVLTIGNGELMVNLPSAHADMHCVGLCEIIFMNLIEFDRIGNMTRNILLVIMDLQMPTLLVCIICANDFT